MALNIDNTTSKPSRTVYRREHFKMNNRLIARELVRLAKAISRDAALDVTPEEQVAFKVFAKDLAKLSKKHGVAIKSVGGVTFGPIKSIRYSDDATSGDLLYTATWAD